MLGGVVVGPLSSVTVMGQTLVIINDMKLAFELLEKRSVKHSSRPNQIFAGQMYVGDKNFASFSSEHLPLANHGRA